MSNNLKDNPFAALFNSVNDAEHFQREFNFAKNSEESSNERFNEQNSSENGEITILERLLLTSTDVKKPAFSYIYLENVPPLNCDTVDVILFERVMLNEPSSHIINPEKGDVDVVGRREVILYLFETFDRCWSMRKSDYYDIIKTVEALVITNLATALEQPDIFDGQDPRKQFISLVFGQLHNSSSFADMLTSFLEYIQESESEKYVEIFEGILNEANERLKNCSLLTVDWNILSVIDFYSSFPILSSIVLKIPKGIPRNFQTQTILGTLLSISCIPKQLRAEDCDFFENPSSQPFQSHKSTIHSISVAQGAINNRLSKIFMNFLKNSLESRNLFLKWIESCLESNSGRAGVWHIHTDELRNMSFVNDGFMINLTSILLKLCSPLTKDVFQKDNTNYKILKVDSLYCSPLLSSRKDEIPGLYPADIPKQTMLVPSSEHSVLAEVDIPERFAFTTSCFFLTQRAFHLGIQVAYQKISKLSQELGRLQHEYEEVSNQASEGVEMIRKHMEERTTIFLSYKAAVFNSALVDDVLEFMAATSLWITQLAFKPVGASSAVPMQFKEITLKDLIESSEPDDVHSNRTNLEYVPEFIVENMVESIISINRFSHETLLISGDSILQFFMNFVSIFMGSTHRMNNPHLRAHLAECLETLIPKDDSSKSIVSSVRDRLFLDHPLAKYLPTAIINVFVSIEMTGQSVAFEEKFNYRRPMYEVMKYLWNIPDHKRQFISLSTYALSNMESAKPPLFLRFVNLLINDAIFLLDEGLSYLSQIREGQLERESEEWNNLTDEQRAERERNIRQNGLMARFHNMLGSSTIQTLLMLTEDIPEMFTHPTLVDRIAAMLNHFLNHLVGPKQRNLKVKDMERYEFRPSETVSDICTIYIHLSKRPEFCDAVSADDRSYSPHLFYQACKVLAKIGRIQLQFELELFGQAVEKANKKKMVAEDLVAAAPERYIDPIMSNLMKDPVMLPSSRMVVDRQTIARHLLSDQTDPFNRQPLTMEEIIVETDLKKEIEDWISEQEVSRGKV